MSKQTPLDKFGADIVNRLALWAIDVACEAPAKPSAYRVQVRARTIAEGRAILEEAGIDWLSLAAQEEVKRQERKREAYEKRSGSTNA